MPSVSPKEWGAMFPRQAQQPDVSSTFVELAGFPNAFAAIRNGRPVALVVRDNSDDGRDEWIARATIPALRRAMELLPNLPDLRSVFDAFDDLVEQIENPPPPLVTTTASKTRKTKKGKRSS